jgi:transcriptional regulator GlxA family with amidase domain
MVKQAQAYIENHLDEKISVEKLSSRFAVGRRNFDHRFIKATGNTPICNRQKLNRPRKLLKPPVRASMT